MNRTNTLNLLIRIPEQTLSVFKGEGETLIKHFPVSTAYLGAGEQKNSFKTPRGLHQIRAKIGAGALPNTVFVRRRPTGEIYSQELATRYPDRDWMLTRLLWLSGLEKGKNYLGKTNTFSRYIYIHGCPDTSLMGEPLSHGCIRMRNHDIIELFDWVVPGTRVLIIDE